MKKKGIVLITIIIITLLITIMAGIVTFVMTQQAYLAEYKIKRTRAYYAAMAAVTELHATLRKDPNVASPVQVIIGKNTDGAPYPITVIANIINAPAEFPTLKKLNLSVIY